MICHSGNQKHSGNEITKGIRYILVIFLKIKNIINLHTREVNKIELKQKYKGLYL